MSDFIREVDEDLRHDQFRRFVERYWIVLVILAILVLAGVGAWEAYDYLRTQRAQTAGGSISMRSTSRGTARTTRRPSRCRR